MPRNLLCCTVLALALACNAPPRQAAEKEPAGLRQLEWLLGRWEFVSPDSALHRESWERQSDTLFGGFGFVRQGDSLVFSEILSLSVANDTLYYTAQPEGQNDGRPVRFTVTALDSAGFVCENPAHDFPNRITYRRRGTYPDDSLVAVISGPGRNQPVHEIEFAFRRAAAR
jgi:hypothetical protein